MSQEFYEVVERRTHKIEKVLASKAEEYASQYDRFHNFNVAARIGNTTPEKALVGMWMKHLVSVFDLVEWVETEPGRLTEAMIDEKIGDAINYLILLEGMLRKRAEAIYDVRPVVEDSAG